MYDKIEVTKSYVLLEDVGLDGIGIYVGKPFFHCLTDSYLKPEKFFVFFSTRTPIKKFSWKDEDKKLFMFVKKRDILGVMKNEE